MLVQYEDENRPPTLISAWSWQDSQGSWVLIALAWIGLLIGVAGALYWAHLSVLGAFFGGRSDWPGYIWIALTAAGAALIAPVLWPFLEDRRPQIAKFVLTIGVICWLITSALGTLYMIAKAEAPGGASLATAPIQAIRAALDKDFHSIIDAEHDCSVGIRRGCAWLDSRDGGETRARLGDYKAELARRAGPARAEAPPAIRAIITGRQRFILLAIVALGGAIALAMLWGSAEAMKAMYAEPSAMPRGATIAADGLPGGALGNPVDDAFEAWASRCLERARGERIALATMHAHYRAWCLRRGLPTFASDEAFGRALNRQPDPTRPGDLGGPMVRYQAYPIKTGGRMEYIGVRIAPDDILDEIEAAG
jgi:hypothetical protein